MHVDSKALHVRTGRACLAVSDALTDISRITVSPLLNMHGSATSPLQCSGGLPPLHCVSVLLAPAESARTRSQGTALKCRQQWCSAAAALSWGQVSGRCALQGRILQRIGMAWALASTPLLVAVLLLGIAMQPTAGMAGTAEVLRKVGPAF